jgi:type IV pilus assembly protein PilN
MRIPINLSSQPFRRDRPMLVGSGILAILLIGLLGALVSLAMMDRGQRADLRREIAQLQTQLTKVTAEQAKVDAVIRKPENAAVLDQTFFFNSLLYRKGISWTRLLADLEKVMPHNVQLAQVRPSVNSRNQITLDMTVAAETPEPIIDLVKSLEGSRVFALPSLRSSAPPNQNEKLYRYRVSVNYVQQL